MKKGEKINTSLPATIDYSTKESISSLISKFTVRILYLGGNRNGTYFTREVVDRMINTIGGIPVIGDYDAEKGDFLGHGEVKISVDEDGEVKAQNVELPAYGYVPNDPRVWWEKHLDEDGVEREYLCTEVYLWTGRYSELEALKEGNNNQSMELNPKVTTGEFTEIDGQGYYVVTRSEFLGLCILGKDVEPCFEGAGFNFSLNNYKTILSQMKEELQIALTEYEKAKEPEEDEFKDNDLDNLDGPTTEELEALERELAQVRADYQAINKKLEEYKNKNTVLEEALAVYKNKEDRDKKILEFNTYLKDQGIELSTEEYKNIIDDVDKCDVNQLIEKAKNYDYERIRDFYRQHKEQEQKDENEPNFNFTLNTTTGQGNESFLDPDSWQKVVLDRQRRMEEQK